MIDLVLTSSTHLLLEKGSFFHEFDVFQRFSFFATHPDFDNYVV